MKIKTSASVDDETVPAADEEMANFMSCFAMLSTSTRSNRRKIIGVIELIEIVISISSPVEYHPPESSSNNNNNNSNNSCSNTSNNPAALSRLTPGAYSSLPTAHKTHSIEESLSLDISQLRKQYKKLQERNKQVQVMIQSTNRSRCEGMHSSSSANLAASNEQRHRTRAPSMNIPPATENYRRTTITSLEFSTPKLPATVCSITGGPLVSSCKGDSSPSLTLFP